MQKIQQHGKGDVRYFWNIKGADGKTGVYRSRHSTAAGVRQEFARAGQKLTSVTQVRA